MFDVSLPCVLLDSLLDRDSSFNSLLSFVTLSSPDQGFPLMRPPFRSLLLPCTRPPTSLLHSWSDNTRTILPGTAFKRNSFGLTPTRAYCPPPPTMAAVQPKWHAPAASSTEVQARLPKLSIYNSLTRSKTPFVPRDSEGRKVGWYACGPTVYDDAVCAAMP